MSVESEESKPGCAGQVLICDDENRLASLTAGLLEEFGYDATTVSTGEGALDCMRQRDDLTLLLLDLNLSSGATTAREVLDAMQREQLNLPVVLTSGFAPEDVPSALAQHERVVSYLAKPYTVDELVSAIHRAIVHRASIDRAVER